MLNFDKFLSSYRYPPQELDLCPKPAYFRGQAVVDQAITPKRKGRVYFKGTFWNAECDQNIVIPQHTVVEVVGRREITLLVKYPNQKSSTKHLRKN